MVRGRIPFAPIAATAGGAVLRLLSPGLVALWRDEAQFLAITRLPTIHDLLTFLSASESHPPLFYLLIRGCLALIGDSDRVARLLPVLCSIALIPAVWFVARRVFSDTQGTIAAILVAAAPVLIFTSVQVRPYSLITLLALAGTFALWSALTAPRRRAWMLYVGLSLALIWTHNWGWLYLGGQGILSATWVAISARSRARSVASAIIVAWTVIVLGYLPWAPSLLHQLAHAGHPARSISVLEPLEMLAGTTIGSPDWLGLAVFGLLLARALRSVLRSGRAPDPEWAAGAILFAGMPIAVILLAQLLSPFTDLIVSQCVVTLTPFVSIGLALGLSVAFRAGGARLGGAYAATLILVVLRTGSVVAGTVKTNARTLARAVSEQTIPGDIVMVTPEWYAPAFNHYFPASQAQWDFPSLARVEVAEYANEHERVSNPQTLAAAMDSLAAARAAERRVWLVMDPGWITDSFADLAILPKKQFGRFRAGDLVRSNQLRRELIRLYGPPAMTIRQRGAFESLCAMLFEPGRQLPASGGPKLH